MITFAGSSTAKTKKHFNKWERTECHWGIYIAYIGSKKDTVGQR